MTRNTVAHWGDRRDLWPGDDMRESFLAGGRSPPPHTSLKSGRHREHRAGREADHAFSRAAAERIQKALMPRGRHGDQIDTAFVRRRQDLFDHLTAAARVL